MDIDKEIEMAEKDLKDLIARKKSAILFSSVDTKKSRADKGVKRTNYKSHLPLKFRQYISRANQKGLPFTLTVEEFQSICNHPCVYCGSLSKITIDRKDSSDGYTLENSQPCCYTCNTMKWSHSEEQFLQHIANIFKYRS